MPAARLHCLIALRFEKGASASRSRIIHKPICLRQAAEGREAARLICRDVKLRAPCPTWGVYGHNIPSGGERKGNIPGVLISLREKAILTAQFPLRRQRDIRAALLFVFRLYWRYFRWLCYLPPLQR